MKKILLVEKSKNFISDIQRNMLINARDDIKIMLLDNINSVDSMLASDNYDLIVINASLVESRDWDFGIPVRSYADKVIDIDRSESYRIKCYGLIKKAATLIEDIAKDDFTLNKEESERPTNVLTSEDMPDNLKNWNQVDLGEKLKKNQKPVNIPSYGETNEEVKDMPLQEENQNSLVKRGQKEIIDMDPTDYQQMANFNSPYGANSDVYRQQQGYPQQQIYQNQGYMPPQNGYGQNNMPVPYLQPIYSYQPSYQGQQPLYIDNFGRAVYEIIPMRQPQYQNQGYYQQNQYNEPYQQNPYQQNQYANPYQQNQQYPNYQTQQTPNQQNTVQQNQYYGQNNQYNNQQGSAYNNQKSQQTPSYNTQSTQKPVEEKNKYSTKTAPKNNGGFTDINDELDAYLANEEKKDRMREAAEQKNNPNKTTASQNKVSNQNQTDKTLQDKANERIKQSEEKAVNEAKILAEKQFNKDIGNVEKQAKCIAVYSAKGGVGKTKISCELATFLALTKHNRGENYKVCIADFNIDFGDVMSTLYYQADGATMTTWAEDIRARIARGENVNDINYTYDEISVWLQKNVDSGLYALLAPISNIDSMNIGGDEIKVMINNLVRNCGFDYVICDTGNNTRDSSFIALENADLVELVITQDVNTVTCNKSFLQTAQRVGFDMSKIKMVINFVRPSSSVGVSLEDIKSAFKDENGKPYNFELITTIKQYNEAVKSTNTGIPIVYNSSHEFTRSIGEMVGKITGQERVLTAPKKENIFNRIFKK